MQVAVERFGGDIDFEVLSGLWKLRYTTATDVVRFMPETSRSIHVL